MKQFYRMFAPVILLISLLPLKGAGQEEAGGLFLSGKITTEQGSVDGTIIRMTRNGQPMKDYQVLPDGRFNLRFEFNNDYVLVFTRPENFPQKLTINTHVPNDVLRRDRKFPPFPVDISLFTEIKGIDRTFSENAIMKIFYSPSVDNFIPEIYYNNPQIKKLIDQAILQSQNVTREYDLLKRLTAAELAELKKEYDEFLVKAASEFDRGEYILSLGDYKAAGRIFPHEQYPKDRIAEINDLIAILGLQEELEKQTTEKYNQFIREADRQFTAREYPASRDNYSQALFLKPGDAYSTGRISEIDRLIAEAEQVRLLAEKQAAEQARLMAEQTAREAALQAEQARIEKQYQEAVASADQLFNLQQYSGSIEGYRNALKIKPGEPYPAQRIAEAEAIMAELTATQKAYNEAIATADKAFRQQQYRQARKGYEDALKIKSSEKYPEEMLDKIDAIEEEMMRLAEEKNRLEEEKKAREQAAREAAEAERIRLAEEKARLEAEKLAREQAAREAAEAEKARLEAERIAREEAARLAAAAEKEKRYNETVALADDFFNRQQYARAITEYRNALKEKPGESYPQEKITESEKILADLAALQKAYDAAIAAGDKAFRQKQYGPARESFQQAQALKSEEKYPAEMVTRIDAIEAEQAKLAEEKERLEAEKLAREQAARKAAEAERIRLAEEKARIEAEKLAKEQAAREAAEAERIRLAEEKARLEAEKLAREQAAREAAEAEKARLEAERIAREEAARLAAEAEKARQEEEKVRLAEENRNKEYARLIMLADQAFESKQLVLAASNYKNALLLKPNEIHPKNRLVSIDSLQVVQQNDEKYRHFLVAADAGMRSNEWEKARENYGKASEIKPEEEYPQRKIREIDEILQKLAQNNKGDAPVLPVTPVEQSAPSTGQGSGPGRTITDETSALYNGIIAMADQAFDEKSYNVSRAWYYKALAVKPGEPYPTGRIAEINRIIASLQLSQLEREFQGYIDKGDEAFRTDQLAVARGWYNRSLNIKSNDSYALSQIADIQMKVEERLQGNTENVFRKYIEEGDNAFRSKNYNIARVWYHRARELKPSDPLTGEKLENVRKALSGE
ncbi:MAG: Tetratricopeptide repeat protein [Bacteroidetes bacterium ADurb.Bin123]|nr:MAG: Tetratricopeptide repeat protein [Bacteroidetes bacterium ADurb.Bin123]